MLSDAEFARMTGKQRSVLSEIISGKRAVSKHYVRNIIECYPQLNEDWLFTGKGEMLKQDNPQPKSEDTSLLLLLVDSMKNTIETQKALLDAKQAEIERLQRAMEEKFGKEPK